MVILDCFMGLVAVLVSSCLGWFVLSLRRLVGCSLGWLLVACLVDWLVSWLVGWLGRVG